MAVRPVVALPDAILKAPAAAVGRIDDAARALAADLIDTMRASPAFAVDITGHKKAQSCHGEFVLFDPEVLLAHGPEVGREGCMSVPDYTGDVARATRVVVRGFDEEGRDRVIQADAFEARAIQHELDHLDGLLFLDRVASHHAVFRRKTYR